MKKILLSLTIALCVATTLSAQKPEAKIKGIEVGANVLSGYDDPVILAYTGVILPTKFENIDWTIGITSDIYLEGNTIGLYSGIDGYWGIFTAGASVGLWTLGEDATSLSADISVGLKLGWQKVYFNPQVSMMIIGNYAYLGFKLPLTITF